MTKNDGIWWEAVKVAFQAVVICLAWGMITAGLYHLWLHCSPQMAVGTGAGVTVLLYYAIGGVR